MWHLLLLNYCGIEQVEQRWHKSRIMHFSIFHYEYLVTGHIDLHFCENRAHIKRLTHLEPHTIEVAHDPDLTIPGGYDWHYSFLLLLNQPWLFEGKKKVKVDAGAWTELGRKLKVLLTFTIIKFALLLSIFINKVEHYTTRN